MGRVISFMLSAAARVLSVALAFLLALFTVACGGGGAGGESVEGPVGPAPELSAAFPVDAQSSNFGLSAARLPSVVLSDSGASTLAWPFEEETGWHIFPGSEFHAGDDAWAQDWNWGGGSDDLGKTLLSAIEGKVVFVGKGVEAGYGEQVVIQSGDFALRYAHMNRVDVHVGDQAELGTPLGTVGHSGGDFSPHGHIVLYRHILEKSSRFPGETGLDRLLLGDNPTTLSGSPSAFAAEFTCDPEARVTFTLEDAAHRLSPVLSELSGLPAALRAGETYDVKWSVMGYHGPMQCGLLLQHENERVTFVVDDTPEAKLQGWRWDHAYSRYYAYARRFTIPSDAPLGEYQVRFFWSRMDRGPLNSDRVPASDKAFLSVLIPGGVDPSPEGDEGRMLRRTVLEGVSGVAGTPLASGSSEQVNPTADEAANRLSPVLRELSLPISLKPGTTQRVEWAIMSYHSNPASMIQIECGDKVVKATDPAPKGENAEWKWGSVYARLYRYSVDLQIPNVPGGKCRVRFFWAQPTYSDSRGTFLSVLIPGGVDDAAEGNVGRAVLRDIAGGTSGGSTVSTKYTITPANVRVGEADGSKSFVLQRSGPLPDEKVYVSTTTTEGASNLGDFVAWSKVPVQFAAGESSQKLVVYITNNTTSEGDETFGLIAQRGQSQDASEFLAAARFTIADDDAAATVYSISANPASVNESGGSVSFTITRSGGTPLETVYISTTKTEGFLNNGDYTGRDSEPLAFTAGQTTKTVIVYITNDLVRESNEKFGFIVQRKAADPVAVFLAKVTWTILNDD